MIGASLRSWFLTLVSDCSREAQSHDVEPVHLHSTHLPSPPQPSSPITSSSPTQWSSSDTTFSPPRSFHPHHPSLDPLTPPVQPPLSPPQPSSPVTSSSPTLWSSSNDTSSPSSPPSRRSPYPSFSLTQPRTLRPTNPPPSRLESSLLKLTPVQYSRSLQNSLSSYSPSEDPPVWSGTDEVDAGRQSAQQESTSSSSSSQSKPARRHVYTPFMKLMEMTAKINIEGN